MRQQRTISLRFSGDLSGDDLARLVESIQRVAGKRGVSVSLPRVRDDAYDLEALAREACGPYNPSRALGVKGRK